MKFIQKQERGIGLAANQIGISKRIITAYNEATKEIIEFINPRLTGGTPQSNYNVNWDHEGCLSHPGIIGEVARYQIIEFIAQRLQDTKEHTFTARGWLARIVQHEIDHINGLLFVDLGPEVRNLVFVDAGQKLLMSEEVRQEVDTQKDFVIE